MAVKKSKSRVATSAKKKGGFKFRWWMAVILVVLVAGIGIAVLRFSQASGNTPAPKGPIYMIGDSLSYGLIFEGNINQKLESSGYSPAVINANPGRSITAGGFQTKPGDPTSTQDAIQAVDADNKNLCQTSTNATVKAYCQAHNNSFNPVKDAKTIVVFLGTNAEANPAGFDLMQTQMLDKVKKLNPNAKIVWVDIAAPGNKAAATNNDTLSFSRLSNPNTTTADLVNQFNQSRTRLLDTQNTIYNNATKLGYSVISQFRFLWPQFGSPTTDFSKITDQKDSKGYVSDGTHYVAAGSQALADYIVNALSSGNFSTTGGSVTSTPAPSEPTTTTTSEGLQIPIAISAPLTIDLVNPPNFVALSQNDQNGCKRQVSTIKNSVDFEGCKINVNSQLQLKPNEGYKENAKSFLFSGQKINTCVTSKTTNKSQPVTITFMKGGQPVAIVPTTHGSGSEFAELITCGTSTVGIKDVDTIVITSPVETIVGKVTFANSP